MRSLPAEDQIKFIKFNQEMETLGLLVAERPSWDKFKLMFYDARENIPDSFSGKYFQWLAECIPSPLFY